MALALTIKQVKKKGRGLYLYQVHDKYKLVYETDEHDIVLKSKIEDKGYAMYLFKQFKKEFNL